MLFLETSSWFIDTTEEKGRGIFTKKEILPGEIIGDYTGTVIHPMDADQYEKGEHFYLMYYHDYASVFPDLSKPDIYLLNHSCQPNCWMYTYKGHTLFFALRHIFPGEELTISYLLSPQDSFCEPCNHLCKCGSTVCTKSMHLSEKKYIEWKKVSTQIAGLTKRERVRKGKNLPLLSEYPTSIPDHPIYSLFGNTSEKASIDDAKILPSTEKLRELIRKSGRMVSFPSLGYSVVGIVDNTVITMPQKTFSIHPHL